MNDQSPIDLSTIATNLRRAAYNSYLAMPLGGLSPRTQAYVDRGRTPQVGDMVVEVTTVERMRRLDQSDLDAVGILEKIVSEKVDYDDDDFEWDEQIEGRPHPEDPVYYIRTLDGRLFRWVNATFIALVTELPL